MVSWSRAPRGFDRYPTGKGSGEITSLRRRRLFEDRCAGRQMTSERGRRGDDVTPHVRVQRYGDSSAAIAPARSRHRPRGARRPSVRSIEGRQPRRPGGGAARRGRFRTSICSMRKKGFTTAVPDGRHRNGAGLAADAGHRVRKGRQTLRGPNAEAAVRSALGDSPASWSNETQVPAPTS